MSEMTVNDALKMALELHRSGDADAAEEIYRQVVEQAPGNADALHLLGICVQQRGRHEEAVKLFHRAIAANNSSAEFHYNLGNSLLFLRRATEAETAYAR